MIPNEIAMTGKKLRFKLSEEESIILVNEINFDSKLFYGLYDIINFSFTRNYIAGVCQNVDGILHCVKYLVSVH